MGRVLYDSQARLQNLSCNRDGDDIRKNEGGGLAVEAVPCL